MRIVGLTQIRKTINKELRNLPFLIGEWGEPRAMVIPFDKELGAIIEKHELVRTIRNRVNYAKRKEK